MSKTMTALVVWTLVTLTTILGIVWAEHTHPERYTAEAAARRWATVEVRDDEGCSED